MVSDDYVARLCLNLILENSEIALLEFTEKDIYFAMRNLSHFSSCKAVLDRVRNKNKVFQSYVL